MRGRGLVCVGALALLLTGCGGGSSSIPAAAPAPQVVAGDFRCPDPEAPAAGDDGSDILPSDAQAAVLCLHDNHDAWAPPTGVLVTGLDDLVGVANSQRIFHPDPNTGCGGVGAPAWTVVLRYAGGIRTISGDNGGCWDLLVGRTQRYGSAHVYDAYLQALLQQRRAQTPPDVARKPPACPNGVYPAASPAADPRLLVAAAWCRRAGEHWRTIGALSPAQLAILRHDVRTSASRHRALRVEHCRGLRPSTVGLLVGRDAWGDTVAIDFTCDFYRLFEPAQPRASFVRMLPSSLAVVTKLEHS